MVYNKVGQIIGQNSRREASKAAENMKNVKKKKKTCMSVKLKLTDMNPDRHLSRISTTSSFFMLLDIDT